MEHLGGLNERQKEVVLHKDGPILILAGAGAGKTKTITHRILHLIKEGVAPHEILAITFTNKAAKEMRERVHALLNQDKVLNIPISFNEKPFVSTFHSLGVHIIKEQHILLGLPKNFSILDRADSKRIVKEAEEKVGIDSKQFEPAKVLAAISRQKGNMVTAEIYESRVGNGYTERIVSQVWNEYEKLCFAEKALDFDDLLLKVAILLRKDDAVRAHYAKIWKYIHIDEYQDTNKVQYSISKTLAEAHRNVCAVGDADQTIYTWRGADISNILNFEHDYPEAKVVLLEQNYRSTKNILEAANAVIEKNKNRKKKKLFTENNAGEKISLYGAYDEMDEAHFMALKSKELIGEGIAPEEIAVLYRANFQSRAIEEAFLAHNTPYHVLGTRFFERKEVKDIVSYIKAALNPESLSDVKRVINTPVRGVGKVSLLKVLSGQKEKLPPNLKNKVDEFYGILGKIKTASETYLTSALVRYTTEISGMKDMLEKEPDGEERMENTKELVTLASRYDGMGVSEGLEKFIEDISLASDQDSLDQKNSAVRLMTVHASKGLEFKYVFIGGLEENLFPHTKDGEVGDEEEERRLFYVALTRAKEKLYLSYAGVRTIFGSKQINIPSQFLGEVGEHLIEPETSPSHGARKVIYFD